MKIKEIAALYSLFNALSLTFGFTTNQSEWSVVPQLNPRPQVSVEVLMKDVETKGIDGALRSTEEKKSLKRQNVTIARTSSLDKSGRENEGNLIVHLLTEPELLFDQQEKFIKTSRENSPLNVILLLIDGLDAVEEDLKIQLENPAFFSTQGFLQSCPEKPNTNNEGFYFDEINAQCDCDALLRSNIDTLLSWAQNEREMSTSILYEMPTVYSRRIEMDSRNFMSPLQARRIDHQLHESWHQSSHEYTDRIKLTKASPTSRTEARKSRGRKDKAIRSHEEGRVSSTLSRLREAFFRTLLRSLSGNEQDDREQHKRRSFSPRGSSNFHELAARTLEELNSMPNKWGYVLVATTGARELAEALELFRHYVSPSNTLIIITSPCPRDKTSLIPFYAHGPHSEYIAETNPSNLHEIPSIIRAIIGQSRECRESPDCDKDLYVKPSVLSFEDPVLIFSDEGFPFERFARDNTPDDKPQQKLKRSEKEHKEKVSVVKKPQEITPIVSKRMGVDKVTLEIDNSKNETENPDPQVKFRMDVKNSQNKSLPSLIFIIMITALTTLALEH